MLQHSSVRTNMEDLPLVSLVNSPVPAIPVDVVCFFDRALLVFEVLRVSSDCNHGVNWDPPPLDGGYVLIGVLHLHASLVRPRPVHVISISFGDEGGPDFCGRMSGAETLLCPKTNVNALAMCIFSPLSLSSLPFVIFWRVCCLLL